MKTVYFPDGASVPALGQGSWMMAQHPDRRAQEIASLRVGIELGLTLIDTAEMYADGDSEVLVGEAISGRRDGVFLVSKAYPNNASRSLLPRACEASLKRLGTDRLDLYLLHWRGGVDLGETVEAMETLVASGKILRWGVSNLDTADMTELLSVGGRRCQSNQILYNLSRRGPEYTLIPWLAAHDMPVMAYSPVEQGRLVDHTALTLFAAGRGATAAQIALAWLLARDGVIAIPKAGTPAHMLENRAAADFVLSDADRRHLDKIFPAPHKETPLEML